jgi:iron complex outermembrane receptor protein
MSNKLFRGTLLASTIFAGASVAAPAYAQVANPTEGAGIQSQEAAAPVDETSSGDIVVTGTLIRNPNLVSSSPVAVVGQEEISLRQSNTAEQLLREIPGVAPNLGSNVNNGTAGVSRVDLRGLGPQRNIVLLDGRRLVPSSFFGAVDLNNIPLALIDRVDVLTGGASTTYGADAVSGVVNFITRRDFAGMDATLSQQISEKGDTNVFRADLTVGANFDDGRGNAVLSVGYQEADPLYFGERDSGTFTINSGNGIASGDSFTSVPAAFSFPTADLQISPDGSRLVDFYNFFNFNPYNVYVTPFQRFNFFGAANYEVSDTVEVYSRALFSKNTVSSIIAASGIFGNSLTIPGNNPYLNATIRDQLCAANGLAPGATCAANTAIPLPGVYRRTVELGPRISEYVTNIFDYMAGLRLNITDSMGFDLYGSYGESENRETRNGYVANSRIQQALNATNTTTCTNTANACVPLNIFGPVGSITPEMGAFVGGITSTVTNAASLAQVHGVFSGDFGFSSPWAAQPIGFAAGGEYRNYGAERRPDSLAQVPGELGGAGGATLPLKGGFDVYEAFGELIAPLVSDRPFFDELTVEAGVRHSKYRVRAAGDPRFSATTYKIGATWAPVQDLKFRGNYQRAVRAPNIGELFAPVVTGLTNLLVDPCAGAAPVANANLRAICLAQGAPVGSIGFIQNPSAGQANATGGGNPFIKPEKATTYSFGVVLQPRSVLSGLTVTADYYNIKVTDAITSATPDDVIAACFGSITAASASSPACTSIRRNRGNGRLSGTSTATNPIPGLPQPLTNSGRLETDGIDLNVAYKTDLGFAALNMSFNGNYVFHSKFQASPTGINRECVGYYSANCASPVPQYSWNQRTTLSFEEVDVSLLWRHMDSLIYEPGLPPLFRGTITGRGALVGRSVDFNKIEAYDYFDLSTRFSVTDNFELTLTAYNIFNKLPPIVGSSAGSTSFNSGNTYPSSYDVVGRRYAASARLKF